MIKRTSGKKSSRLRRAKKTRCKIKQLAKARLCVHRTLNNIYAQILLSEGGRVVATASTIDKEFKRLHKNAKTGNKDAATIVGKLLGERALKKGVKDVAFDRSGFKFHGRVKALAEAAREAGLVF